MAQLGHKSDSLLDVVFSAVTLPRVNDYSEVERHQHESHTETFEYHSVTVGNAFGASDSKRNSMAESEDIRSEATGFSKATSVSIHSSVSQISAQKYDLPQIAHYDVPPVLDESKCEETASKDGSHNSKSSCVSHDSESTITEGTIVAEPVTIGETISSELNTPIAVPPSAEHDAVLNQFKQLHGKVPSAASSIVPQSIHLESDSEDSIAPSKLTESIVTGHIEVLKKSTDLGYTDFIVPIYEVETHKGEHHHDAGSEDSFGFERVEYVDVKEDNTSDIYFHDKAHEQPPHDDKPKYEIGHSTQVVTEDTSDHQIYDAYHEPVVHSYTEKEEYTESHNHKDAHHHVDHTVESHEFNEVKQSRSNTSSTYQSRHILAHSVGPKITEELRPAVVHEEEDSHYQQPPVLAYVDPIPNKPPRNYENSHSYEAYDNEHNHYHANNIVVVKSTTVVHEDIRTGPGVQSLRRKFEASVPKPLPSDQQEHKIHDKNHHHHHHHHHHEEQHHDHIQTHVEHEIHQQYQKMNEHVQLGGSRKSTLQSESNSHHHHHNHHHHHENHRDVPSRPSSVASSVKRPNHSRTSSVSTLRSAAPIQRVAPTLQRPYGDHESVRVVKNVREFVNVFGSTHNVPPPTPLAGIPRLSHSLRSPVSPQTFDVDTHLEREQHHHQHEQHHDNHEHHHHQQVMRSAQSSRKSSCSSVSKCSKSNQNSRRSSQASPGIVVGGHINSRSRQSTITKDNVASHIHDNHHQVDDNIELICVSNVRQMFEKMGPSHLPEYAMSPQALIH